NQLQPFDVAAVFLFADPQIAGRRALVDASQKTRPKPPPPFISLFDIERAGAEPEDLLQPPDRCAQLLSVGEWAVQFRPARLGLPREFHPRKILTDEDFQIRKGL